MTETTDTETTPNVRKRGDSSSRPARERKAPDAPMGWDAFDKLKPKSAEYAENFKPGDAWTIFKFLEAQFTTAYRLHWIERKGKKSWTCLKTYANPEADCPLCDIGDTPRVQVVYNVLDLSDPERPEVKTWTVTSKKLQKQIENFANDPKTSPLNRDNLYWKVNRTGEGTSTVYGLAPVKERDLVDPDDWEWEQSWVLTPDQLEGYADQAYPEENIVKFNTEKELNEIVEERAKD